VGRTAWQYDRIANTAHGLFHGKLGDVRLYDRALSEAEINQLYNMRNLQDAGAQNVPVANSSIVARHPFSKPGATDQSGNGNHGTANGATFQPEGGIETTGAYNCGGHNSVEAPVPSSVQGSAAKSLSAWVQANSLANDGSFEHLVNFGNDSPDQAFGWFLVDKVLKAYHYSNDSNTGYTFPVGVWVHLALTYDGSTSRTYVNGELEDIFNSGTLNTGSRRLAVGANESLAKPSDSRCSEVRIYDRALSAAEVRRIYQSERLIHGGIEKGFKASDLIFHANQWGGGSNNGEVDVTGSQFTRRNGEVVDITPTKNGVALQDKASYEGYVMYSKESVHDRFGDVNGANGDHLAGVTKQGGVWKYDTNVSLQEFGPRPTDILIADVVWGVDSVSKLNIYA
jgi:hypothetical protein